MHSRASSSNLPHLLLQFVNQLENMSVNGDQSQGVLYLEEKNTNIMLHNIMQKELQQRKVVQGSPDNMTTALYDNFFGLKRAFLY